MVDKLLFAFEMP